MSGRRRDESEGEDEEDERERGGGVISDSSSAAAAACSQFVGGFEAPNSGWTSADAVTSTERVKVT